MGVFMQVKWDKAQQRPHLIALKQQLHGARSHPGAWDKRTRCGGGCGEQVGCREPGSCCRAAWGSWRSSEQYSSSNPTGLPWVSATLGASTEVTTAERPFICSCFFSVVGKKRIYIIQGWKCEVPTLSLQWLWLKGFAPLKPLLADFSLLSL